MTTNSTLLIVDGNNMAHRARHTFSLSNRGVDVSVTFGVIKYINALISKFKPYAVMMCWDGGTPDFRRKSVPEYKARRHDSDDQVAYDDFLRQLKILHNYALPNMGIVNVRKLGAEADDLMYHASRLSPMPSIIVTTDKDLFQAINDDVRVYNPTRGEMYKREDIEEMYDIKFDDYIHWRAIQGDSSDNIRGVKGIGPKTASKLFKQYNGLTGITNAALGKNPVGKITGKLATNICSFGFDRICQNVYAMALYADRVGARLSIIDAVDTFNYPNIRWVKRYLMNNAFVSLMDGGFYNNLMSLSIPMIENNRKNVKWRTPVVCGRRFPDE